MPAITPKVPSHILDSFHDLPSNNVQKRLKSSLNILKFANLQISTTKNDLSSCEEINYILTRLLNGLYSSRESAREGYFTTLESLLKIHPKIHPLLVDLYSKRTSDENSSNTAEMRDEVLGEMMLVGALIKSGCIYKNQQLCQKSVERILELSKFRDYTKSIAYHMLVEFAKNDEVGYACNEILKKMASSLSSPLEYSSLQTIWLRVTLMSKMEVMDNPPEWLGDIFSKHNYKDLIKLLSSYVNQKTVPIEFAPLVDGMLNIPTEDIRHIFKFWEEAISPIINGWKICKDGSKTKLIFSLAEMMLPDVKSKSEISTVLTSEFIAFLIDCTKESKLYGQIKSISLSLIELVKKYKNEQPDIPGIIVSRLVEDPSDIRIDKLTQTKTLNDSIIHLNKAAILSLANVLTPKIVKLVSEKGMLISEQEKRLSCQLLVRLTTHTEMTDHSNLEWKTEQLVTLMTPAFFMQETQKDIYKDFFFKALNAQSKALVVQSKILKKLMSSAKELFPSSNINKKEDLTGHWEHIMKQLHKVTKTDTKLMPEAIDVFIVLYAHLAFMVFIDKDEAVEIMEELDACYKNASKQNKKKKKSLDTSTSSDLPFWVDIIVELLLSLLVRENNSFRLVAQAVFKNLCPLLTPAALTSVTDVLLPEKVDVEHTEEEMEVEGESEEEGESDGDGDEEDKEDEEEENDGDKEDIVEESDSDMEEDDLDDKILEMKTKMFAVIGLSGEGDVDMDSVPLEQQNKMDEELGAVLAQYLKNKKKTKPKLAKDETLLMHFKTRVCDLVGSVIDTVPSMSLILQLIQPLIISYKAANKEKLQEPLKNRLMFLLNKLSHIKKFTSNIDVSEKELVASLNSLYEQNSEDGEHLTVIVGGCCSLVMHCGLVVLKKNAHTTSHQLIQAYQDHLNRFIVDKDIHLGWKAYSPPFNLDYGGLWGVANQLTEHTFSTTTRLYRRTQSIDLLIMFFNNSPLIKRGSETDKTNIITTIVSKSIEILKSIESTSDVKQQYTSKLLELLLIISQSFQESLNKDELGEAIIKFSSTVTLRDLKPIKNQLNKLCKQLNIEQPKKQIKENNKKPNKKVKNKPDREEKQDDNDSDDNSDIDENTNNKKKKKGKSEKHVQHELNKKKNRKRKWIESRKRQLGSQVIDELEEISFAKAVNLDLPDDIDEPMIERKRGKVNWST